MPSFLRPFKSKKMRIVHYGHPALRKTSEPIAVIDESVRTLADRMTYTLTHNDVDGVGLAAPQVGVNKRLIIIDTWLNKDEPQDESTLSPGERLLNPLMPVALVNPEITLGPEMICSSEGCLSLPGVSGELPRAKTIILQAKLLDGRVIQVECDNLLAVCLQHEIDHLDGTLFIDKATDDDKKQAENTLRELAQAEARIKRR